MSHILPKVDSQLVTIGQAANILDVSIDTIRRWDKKGKLSSVRLDGKNRYFSIVELQNLKENLPMTVSKVATQLGISASTLRRYEKKGAITSSRSEKGDRLYNSRDIEVISKILKAPKKKVMEERGAAYPGQGAATLESPQEAIPERRWSDSSRSSPSREINIRISLPKLPAPSRKSLAIMASIVLILLASFQDSRKDSNVLAAQSGFNLRDVVGEVLSYMGRVGENIVNQYKYVFVPGSIQEGLVTIEEKLITADLPDGVATLDASGIISGLRITGANILSGAVTAVHIATDAVTSSEIKNEEVMGEDIAPDAVGNSELANDSVESANIRDNTVEASDLATILTFSDADYIDLSRITHGSTSQMGLRLPNTSSATPSEPSSGEGFLAYDTAGNQVVVYDGLNWTTIGGSVTLATGGGLAYSGGDLTLLRSCDSGQLLKWNGSAWACGNDTGGAGGGIATIEKANVNVFTTAVSLDFSADFGVALDSGEGENEGDITIDYTASNITRTDQTQSISGAWTFSNLTVSDTDITLSGGSTTLDITGAATRTLTLLNSTVSQIADLNLSDGGLFTGGTSRLTNTGALQNITGLTVSSGTVSLPADQIDTTEINDNGVTLGITQDEQCLTYENTGGYFEWQTCGSGGGGIATVRESDTSPSVGSLTTLEFGPATTSEDEFVVTDQTGGVARVVLGSKVAHINATESISGAWTFSGLTISDTAVDLSGGNTTFDMSAATDTVMTIANGGAGVGKLKIDSLTNGGAGCNTIDTTSDGTLICGTDEGGGGGGIVTIKENDINAVTSATVIDFLGTDFVVGPVGTEGNISIDYPNSGITRKAEAETITGGWTFNTSSTTFTSAITINGGASTAAGTALTLGTGNNGAGAAGNISVDVGTSSVGNGSILIGTAARTQTITIGNATGGVVTVGQNGGEVVINGTNFDIASTGVVTLLGGLTADITTPAAATATAITLKPGTSSGASSNGAAVNITAGDGSGTTSVTGGGLVLTAGSATGGAGTRTGGNVTINAGNGATNDGIITIGSSDTRQINLGNATNNTTLTLTGTGLTTLGGDLQVTGGTFTGADSDVIEVGSVSNTVSFTLGAASEYTFNTTSFTLGADNSIGNGTWSISSTGAGTSLSANDLTGCTNCIGATEVDESGIASTSLSDGANIAHINAAEAISGGWTFGTAATTFSTAINANVGITTSTADTSLAFTTNGAGDYTFAGDSDTNFQINATPTTDATLDSIAITLNATGTGATGTLQGVVISQSENANTGVYDTLLRVQNLKTPEAVTNGILIEQNAAADTMANGLHVLGTAGTITDGINIEDGAGTIADGLQFTGTFTNLINSTNFVVTNAGAITAVGVNSGSGQIAGTGGLSVTGTTAINTNASTSTTAIGTGTTSGAITIGGGSNTITIATTSWDVASDGAFSGLTTLGLSGAITGATATDTINGVIINAGAVSNVGTLSSSGDWTWTAATPTLTVNNTDVLSIGDGTDKITLDTTDANTYFRAGDASNYYTFDFEDGPTYTGTARPTKKVTIVPEYQGATLTGDGGSNVGTMTSDFCSGTSLRSINTSVCGATEEHNYYAWTSTSATQDYDIWVRWQVPSDFAGFDTLTDAVQAYGWRTDVGNTVTVSMFDTAGVIDNGPSGTNVATGTAAWSLVTVESTPGGTYTQGSYVTFRIQMANDTANDIVRVGEITINYKARY